MGGKLWRAFALAFVVLGSGCATTMPCSEEARLQSLQAACAGGECSCEKQCELDFLTCPFSEGTCVTGRSICRQNCGAGVPMQAALTRPSRPTQNVEETE